jgi:hypothetical protein
MEVVAETGETAGAEAEEETESDPEPAKKRPKWPTAKKSRGPVGNFTNLTLPTQKGFTYNQGRGCVKSWPTTKCKLLGHGIQQATKRIVTAATALADLIESNANALATIVPLEAAFSIGGFLFRCTIERFYYQDSCLNAVLRLHINNKLYSATQLVADASHLVQQVKDLLAKTRKRKPQCHRTRWVSHVFLETQKDKWNALVYLLPFVLLSVRNDAAQLEIQQEYLNGKTSGFNVFTDKPQSKGPVTTLPPAALNTLKPVCRRLDWRDTKKEVNPCTGGCFCDGFRAAFHPFAGCSFVEQISLIIAQTPSGISRVPELLAVL